MPVNRHFLSLLCVGIFCLTISAIGHSSADAQPDTTETPTAGLALSNQLGFHSAALNDLGAQGMRQVDQHVTFRGYGHTYHLIHVWPLENERIQLGFGKVLLFQVDGTNAQLLWRNDTDNVYTLLSGAKASGRVCPVPGDWEQNGQIEFGIYWYAINSCPENFSYLDIFVLHRDGSITTRLTNRTIPTGHVVEAVEAQQSGTLLLTVEDIRGLDSGMNFSSCMGPVFRRYFELNGTKMTDVSIWYRRVYLLQIDVLADELSHW